MLTNPNLLMFIHLFVAVLIGWPSVQVLCKQKTDENSTSTAPAVIKANGVERANLGVDKTVSKVWENKF